MLRISPLLFSLLIAAPAFAAGDYHYTSAYNGKLFTMEEVPGRVQVAFDASLTTDAARDLLAPFGQVARGADYIEPYLLLDLATPDPAALNALRALPGVRAVFPLLRDQEGYLKTFAPDQLTVQFRASVDPATQGAVIRSLGARIAQRQRTPGYYTLFAPSDRTLFQAIRDFNAHPAVRFAELAAFGFDDATLVPNDPRFDEQWALDNPGLYGGTPGADINAVQAWDVETGDPDVIISVIDTGIDWDHPDLAAKILPIGDEDWDFSNGPNKIPHDSGYHGTATNGIAGAATDNNTGIAGVAPSCRLMPLKIDLSSGANANRADAINYVVSRKEDFAQIVISCSWRMSSGDFTAVEAACRNARENGIILCFSSGNDNGAVNYPGKYVTTLCVGATSQCDERKSYSSCDGEYWWGSNFGPEMHIAAPGVHITTTYQNGGYTSSFNGTSAACPHAAGSVAMIWSADPTRTAAEAQAILQYTADDQVGPPGEDTPGWDKYMGWGRINLYEAVSSAAAGECDYVVEIQNYPASVPAGSFQSFTLYLANHCVANLKFDEVRLNADGPTSLSTALMENSPQNMPSGSAAVTTVYITVPANAPAGLYDVSVTLYNETLPIETDTVQIEITN
jgi:subtilisin family serine protease